MDRLEQIKKTACLVNNITMNQLESKTRLRHIVDARRMVFSIAKEILEMPYTTIARNFCMNHASIIHHVKQHKSLMDCDIYYKERYNSILELFKHEIGYTNTEELIEEIKRLKLELNNKFKEE